MSKMLLTTKQSHSYKLYGIVVTKHIFNHVIFQVRKGARFPGGIRNRKYRDKLSILYPLSYPGQV